MPVVGLAALWTRPLLLGSVGLGLASAVLVGCILAAVHHAEVVAHRVGEPFGTLILAVAVTVIEGSLILAMMMSGSANPSLPRDTVFAAIMLILNGVVGLCLLIGGLRYGEQRFVLEGVNAALCVLAAMSTLVLILPTFTVETPSSAYSRAYLGFIAVVALALYAIFVFVQTLRHRDYFLPEGAGDLEADEHACPPTTRQAALSMLLLVLALATVVVLAKALSGPLEKAIAAAAFPRAVVGIVVAALVLAPESVAALKAASRNRLQTSLNLALRLCTRHDRPHHTDGSDGGVDHGLAVDSGHRGKGHSAALVVADRCGAVVRNRKDHYSPGRCSPGSSGDLRVRDFRVLDSAGAGKCQLAPD